MLGARLYARVPRTCRRYRPTYVRHRFAMSARGIDVFTPFETLRFIDICRCAKPVGLLIAPFVASYEESAELAQRSRGKLEN